jgi:hypothetical protein
MPTLDYAQPPARRRRIRNRIIIFVCVVAIVVSGVFGVSIYRKKWAELQAATIAALVERSRVQIRHRDYEKALITIDELLALDPTSEYGRGVRPLLYDTNACEQPRKAAGYANWRWSGRENGMDSRY